MRDFFWFAIVTVTMWSVGDYYTTRKVVTISKRSHALEEQVIQVAAEADDIQAVFASEQVRR